MGGIAKLLSFARVVKNGFKFSETKVNPSAGDNVITEHFSDIGDDSYPLPDDYVAIMNIPRSGGAVTVGYIDSNTTKKANAGEKRIYARDSSGIDVVEVWLKNDGSVTISNENGTFTLQPDGEFNINGARITTDGDVITASGVSLDNHPHNQGNDSANDTQQSTNAPTATE